MRTLVFVVDQYSDGRAKRQIVLGTRLDVDLVHFIAWCAQSALTWSSAGYLLLNVFLVELHTRWATVHNTTHRAAMRFAISGDSEVLAKARHDVANQGIASVVQCWEKNLASIFVRVFECRCLPIDKVASPQFSEVQRMELKRWHGSLLVGMINGFENSGPKFGATVAASENGNAYQVFARKIVVQLCLRGQDTFSTSAPMNGFRKRTTDRRPLMMTTAPKHNFTGGRGFPGFEC